MNEKGRVLLNCIFFFLLSPNNLYNLYKIEKYNSLKFYQQLSNVFQRRKKKKKKNIDDKSFPLFQQRRRLVTENLETGRFSSSMNSIEGTREGTNRQKGNDSSYPVRDSRLSGSACRGGEFFLNPSKVRFFRSNAQPFMPAGIELTR